MTALDSIIKEFITISSVKRELLENNILNLKNMHHCDAPPHLVAIRQKNLPNIYEQYENDEKNFNLVMKDTGNVDNLVYMIRTIREFKEGMK